MTKQPWILMLLALLVPLDGEAQDMVLDVSPLRVQLHVMPGAEYTNAVTVTNTGLEPVRLRSYLSDWTMDELGTPIFHAAGTLERTSSPWVDTAPSDFLLDPGETGRVRFTVTVPEGMPDAGYQSALMLETVPLDRSEQRMSRVVVLGRIACMLYVTVGNPRRSAEITSMSAVLQESSPHVEFVVHNTGEDFIRLAGDARLIVNGHEVGDCVELPDIPVLPRGRRRLVMELPRLRSTQDVLTRVTIKIPEAGVLIGECPLYFDRAESVPR